MSETANSQSTNWEYSSLMQRSLSEVQIAQKTIKDMRYNFLSFLATVRALDLEILTITWQSARKPIGIGGTSSVRQAQANIQTSLAFKCVKEKEKREKEDAELFQMLTNEVIVLSHPAIREHHNVAQLQGICFDVTSAEEVWPVLVLEKSEFGDLHNFADMPLWNELDVHEKIRLCVQIGDAIGEMHSTNVIHGDIKPDNILIFHDQTSTYAARVTDFGYSTAYADECELIRMPISQPWNAPELTRFNRRWTPAEAKRMDIFSFGMLVLWVLFKEQLLYTGVHIKVGAPLQCPEGTPVSPKQVLAALMDLKIRNELTLLAQQLLKANESLLDEEKARLNEFFISALSNDPGNRSISAGGFVTDGMHTPINKTPGLDKHAFDHDFKVLLYSDELYACDYRVRIHIAKRLENLSEQLIHQSPLMESTKRIAFQLGTCYTVGFGVRRDRGRCAEIWEKFQLESFDPGAYEVPKDQKPPKPPLPQTLQRLRRQGQSSTIDHYAYFLEHKDVENATEYLFREAADLVSSLGADNYNTLEVKETLCYLLTKQGRFRETEMISLEVIKTLRTRCGDKTKWLLITNFENTLAMNYHSQGHFVEAQKLAVEVFQARKRNYNDGNAYVLNSMGNLAFIYHSQGRYDEAESLESEVRDKSEKTLGVEHEQTLTAMNNLAIHYQVQGRFEQAELIFTPTCNRFEKVLGIEHPQTLFSQNNLLSNYLHQGHYEKAVELGKSLLERATKVLGAEHPTTMRVQSNMLQVYLSQGRRAKAKKRKEEAEDYWRRAECIGYLAVSGGINTLGIAHQDTLSSISDLRLVYLEQKKWEKAEELQSRLLRAMQDIDMMDPNKILTCRDRNMLISVSNLALKLEAEDEWERAEQLLLSVLQAEKELFGVEHPQTLYSMANISRIYWDRDSREKAIEMMEVVVHVCSKGTFLYASEGYDYPQILESWRATMKHDSDTP